MLRVTKETKATLTADTGRVIGFVKDSEPGKVSLAVPADRAVLNPVQARALAAWLNETAATLERERVQAAQNKAMPLREDWLTREREAQRLAGYGRR
ncbi:hypothetical protein [Streptomyces lavendulae]|uniref:hypothetical protein n=1 Tax=Streptomyces lavendulae TaxID=1914 RepID=UPI0036B1B24E